MPLYTYRCKECEHQFDIRQSFSEDSLTDCPNCEHPALRKVINQVGVVFRGKGFYVNDSKSNNPAAPGGKPKPDGNGSENAGNEKSSSSSEGDGSNAKDSSSSDSGGSDGKSTQPTKGESSTAKSEPKPAASNKSAKN
ncbi:MAG: putative FmdB family regulatory protein [Cellvibrionaceae bacterium]|jgi:putative FmdB family regulatory protein